MYITAKVATMVTGSVRLEMIVAVTLRRKMKITVTTRTNVSHSVILTSCTDSRIDAERSVRTSSSTDGGSCSRNVGSSVLDGIDDGDDVGAGLLQDRRD